MAIAAFVSRKRLSLQTLSYVVTAVVVAFIAGLSFLVSSHLNTLAYIAEESRSTTIPLALEQNERTQLIKQVALLADLMAGNPSAQDRARSTRDALRLTRRLQQRSQDEQRRKFQDLARQLQRLSVLADKWYHQRDDITARMLAAEKMAELVDPGLANMPLVRLRARLALVPTWRNTDRLSAEQAAFMALVAELPALSQERFGGYQSVFTLQQDNVALEGQINRLTLEIHQQLNLAALELSGDAALVASDAAAEIARRARDSRSAALMGFAVLAGAFFAVGVALRHEVVKPALLAGNALFNLSRGKEHKIVLSRSDLREIDAINQAVRRLAQAFTETEAANERLVAMAQMKTAFTSSVSHELRTPLTSILGFVKLIRKDFERFFYRATEKDAIPFEKAKRVMHNLDVIIKEGERLGQLINDVLDVAKIESGRMSWRDLPTDIADVVRRTEQAIQGEFAHKTHVQLVADIPDSLPVLKLDADRLQQVLLNLLNNSAKFTSYGEVRMTARVDATHVVIAISDTGMGINADEFEKIFEKFQQSSTTHNMTDKPRGTGLGLAICKQIVEHYGGRIEVASELGIGSTFSVLLPLTLITTESPIDATA